MKAKKIHPSSFTLHPSSLILHPSSFILHPASCIISGIFFGLSAYTYLSSRALPILLAAFTVYLALFARDRMRGHWRGLFVSYLVGAGVALPLMLTLLAQPDLQFRVSEVSGPLDKALQGDWREVGANAARAIGMFTVQGDSTVRDNWPDRPVFPEPIGATLFGAGVVIAITKWRQPRYALALIWIGAMLVPTIVTTGAPNFTRALGALPMVFALPGITVDYALCWLPRLVPVRNFKRLARVTSVLIGVALSGGWGVNAASTWNDYFNQWPNHPETQFVFQADFAAIAKDLDASDVTDVAVGGLSNDTLDDPSLYLLRQRQEVRVRWFDSGSPIGSGGALVQPYGATARVYIPSLMPVALRLEETLALLAPPLSTTHFRRYVILCSPLSVACGPKGPPLSVACGPKGPPKMQPPKLSWRVFADSGLLCDPFPVVPATIGAGDSFEIQTCWQARAPAAYPRRFFLHVIDPATNRIVAQHDGLDSPPQFWRSLDVIIQLHPVTIPPDTPAGHYELWLGFYDPITGQRVLQTDGARRDPPSDHIVLGPLEIVR